MNKKECNAVGPPIFCDKLFMLIYTHMFCSRSIFYVVDITLFLLYCYLLYI